jgi:putative heme-binding domain-containing protein
VFIRKEYMSYELHTRAGRVLFARVIEQDAASFTLVDPDYRKTRVQRSDIASLEKSNGSIMPDGLLDKLTPQQLRDLFEYLQSPTEP